MSDNLQLWHSVERTDPAHTKAITGKSYNGTSPKPHYLVMRATETFGPCGIGWGFSIEERFEDGAMIDVGFFEKIHVAKVKVWFKWNGERGEVEHIGGTVFSGKRSNGRLFSDEDAPKKSVTDALVKALSMVGFAGDIFMGRYDDSKYVNEIAREIDQEKKHAGNEPTMTELLIPIEKALREAAPKGSIALKAVWGNVSPELKPALKVMVNELLLPAAKAADEARKAA